MNKLIIIAFLITLQASQLISKEFIFGYGECIELQDSESETTIDQSVVDKYERIIDFLPVQTPLHKYITGEEDLYLGIIVSGSLHDLVDEIRKKESTTIVDKSNFKKDGKYFVNMLIKNNDMYASLLTYKRSKNKYLIVRLYSNYEDAKVAFDNIDSMTERLNCD